LIKIGVKMFKFIKNIISKKEIQKIEPLLEVENLQPVIEAQKMKKEGNALLRVGDLNGAEEMYRKSININPLDTDTFLNLGWLLSEKKMLGDAKVELNKVLDLILNKTLDVGNVNDNNLLSSNLCDAYYILGSIEEKENNIQGAINYFKYSLKANNKFELVYTDLCRLLFSVGNYDEAKEIILEGLNVNPKNANFHFYLGNIYSHSHEFNLAAIEYNTAISIDETHAEAKVARIEIEKELLVNQ